MSQQPSHFQSTESTIAHLNEVTRSLSNVWINGQKTINYLMQSLREQVQEREALEAKVNALEVEKQQRDAVYIQLVTKINDLEGQIRASQDWEKLTKESNLSLQQKASAAETGWRQSYSHSVNLTAAVQQQDKEIKRLITEVESLKVRLWDTEQKHAQTSMELQAKSITAEKAGTDNAFAGLTEEQKARLNEEMRKEIEIHTRSLIERMKETVQSVNKSMAANRARIKDLESQLEEAKKNPVSISVLPTPPLQSTDTSSLGGEPKKNTALAQELSQSATNALPPVPPDSSNEHPDENPHVPGQPGIVALKSIESVKDRSNTPDVIDLTDDKPTESPSQRPPKRQRTVVDVGS